MMNLDRAYAAIWCVIIAVLAALVALQLAAWA